MIRLKQTDPRSVEAIILRHKAGKTLTAEMISSLLAVSRTSPEAVRLLHGYAEEIRKARIGGAVSCRGLLEFSNICTCDCRYCGIRKSSHRVSRYELERRTIIDRALWCARQGYGSLMLQSGERRDDEFINYLVDIVTEIKKGSVSRLLPDGLGISLSIGEQSYETYKRLFDAGAHRYLLRIETTNRKLFGKIHPKNQQFEKRVECLKQLKAIGYQVGTGVMIGIPGQSLRMLAEDVRFFNEMDIDMIGMGPYIVHPDADMAHLGMMERNELLQLSQNMIAVTRIYLEDVNIAATTALEAVSPGGREQGLVSGANVIMPNATPAAVREGYQLYAGKPGDNEISIDSLAQRISLLGREINLNKWGDAPHAVGKRI